jgi:hypothetical protein
VPYGTDSRLNLFQAINCLDFGELSRVATIIQSLRDKGTSESGSKLSQQQVGTGVLIFFVLAMSFIGRRLRG